jgi:hypothetical protein
MVTILTWRVSTISKKTGDAVFHGVRAFAPDERQARQAAAELYGTDFLLEYEGELCEFAGTLPEWETLTCSGDFPRTTADGGIFSTQAVMAASGCTSPTARFWARKNGVGFSGTGKRKVYRWTVKDLQNFLSRKTTPGPEAVNARKQGNFAGKI